MATSRRKVVFITGGSSGIGYAAAKEFATCGYKVYAGARRLKPMDSLKTYGVIPVSFDVACLASVQAVRDQIQRENDGYLDILYNNAGQHCTFPCLDVTDDQAKQCIEVNFLGPVRTVREFAPLLIKAEGVIGFTGSVSGIVPFPWSLIYSGSKAAIHQYAATLRVEMKVFNVKVINIITGGVKTSIEDTRALTTSSIYTCPEMPELLANRQQMAVRNNPQTPEYYAKNVVSDFKRATGVNGRLNIYRGHWALFLGHLLSWCPRILVEWILTRKFLVNKVFDRVRIQLKAQHD